MYKNKFSPFSFSSLFLNFLLFYFLINAIGLNDVSSQETSQEISKRSSRKKIHVKEREYQKWNEFFNKTVNKKGGFQSDEVQTEVSDGFIKYIETHPLYSNVDPKESNKDLLKLLLADYLKKNSFINSKAGNRRIKIANEIKNEVNGLNQEKAIIENLPLSTAFINHQLKTNSNTNSKDLEKVFEASNQYASRKSGVCEMNPNDLRKSLAEQNNHTQKRNEGKLETRTISLDLPQKDKIIKMYCGNNNRIETHHGALVKGKWSSNQILSPVKDFYITYTCQVTCEDKNGNEVKDIVIPGAFKGKSSEKSTLTNIGELVDQAERYARDENLEKMSSLFEENSLTEKEYEDDFSFWAAGDHECVDVIGRIRNEKEFYCPGKLVTNMFGNHFGLKADLSSHEFFCDNEFQDTQECSKTLAKANPGQFKDCQWVNNPIKQKISSQYACHGKSNLFTGEVVCSGVKKQAACLTNSLSISAKECVAKGKWY